MVEVHAALPACDDARLALQHLGEAWIVAQGMLSSRTGAPSPVRVKQIDAPAPLNIQSLDVSRPIERFAATYAAALVKRAERHSPSGAGPGLWRPSRGDGTVALLVAIAANVEYFMGHPTAIVAWGFWGELEALHIESAWIRRGIERAKRVSIGVPCRECEGVYEIEVPNGPTSGSDAARKRAFGEKGPRASCSLNAEHRMGAKVVVS